MASRRAAKRPIDTANLGDRVHQRIREMLVHLVIPPDSRIGIDSLARGLGVSPTPVREALSRLEAEGLVHRIPNVGFRSAASLSPGAMDYLLELRELVEPFAARRAAETLNNQELAALKAMRAQGRRIRGGEAADNATFGEMDTRFHGLIVAASRNPVFVDILGKAHVHFQLFRQSLSHESAPVALDEHDDVIDALLARDGAAAEAAMRRHIREVRERLKQMFSEPHGPSGQAFDLQKEPTE